MNESTFALLWNPTKDRSFLPSKHVAALMKGRSAKCQWRMTSRKRDIGPGDRFFLFRIGVEPRGVIATGYITSPVRDQRVAIEFDRIIDPSATPGCVLPTSKITRKFPESPYAQLQGSGFRLPPHQAKWISASFGKKHASIEYLPTESNFAEGNCIRVMVNRFERSAKARAACIQYRGDRCAVCKFRFEEKYGDIGIGYIEVHHLEMMRRRVPRKTNPAKDLAPICANCHAMIHRCNPPLTVKQLKALIRKRSAARRAGRR